MNMWKKTMTATVACLMTFSLAACGSSDEGKTAGVSGDIKVYTRDSSSGTREAFEKGVDFEGSLTKNAIEVSSNDDMAAKEGADKNGIGYTSLSTDFEKNGVSALQYEGVTASSESVLDGSYKLQRPFMYVTRAAGDYGSDDKEQLVQAFLDFMQNSTEGMAIVKKNGGEVDESKAKPWDELSKKYEAVLGKDNSAITITTCGSTSVEKTVKASLEAFSPMAGNFKFTMNQSGSGDAVPRVLGKEKDGPNKGDIGFASRAFKEDGSEDISKAMESGQYCIDAVVAVVNKENTDVTSLTQAQLKSIFTGETLKWEDIK
ncbi:substrate-binding domain-containing protein [[Clostridium] innocuum]|uniref:Substrate-binding domain-containing protein n=1 Tax=Clostridium innocuum TaxID=1522 RepID=A0AAP2UMJ0_CLOIN|nr:substrate-binding domain-containing protein [[Clostridium] innocuum]